MLDLDFDARDDAVVGSLRSADDALIAAAARGLYRHLARRNLEKAIVVFRGSTGELASEVADAMSGALYARSGA